MKIKFMRNSNIENKRSKIDLFILGNYNYHHDIDGARTISNKRKDMKCNSGHVAVFGMLLRGHVAVLDMLLRGHVAVF